ncbi:uncharacterized protein LY89DRAFT_717732 [Mollisia scopiformis]|uniref:Uncharacterized protein n=1 Tax=Mollisia scopiformis TaxID=149040 RepID=A0A194XD78_MOLSC|nr:uncharacterized protein LY89DRAFT_717732 [Mollisia scopiformis]KUJ18128.1 hypothetical protein LY89DRAFT_717732 [Mollisia scopiformis]
MSEPTSPVAENSYKKPLPLSPSNNGRPGTSGTELGLRANREKASSAYERAQRAEAAYRAKRRATYARKDYQAAKEHFKNAGKSFKEGSKCAWLAVKAGPAILMEKKEKMREGKEKKDREKAEEKKRLWEEKAKKKSVDEGTDGEEAIPTVQPVSADV